MELVDLLEVLRVTFCQYLYLQGRRSCSTLQNGQQAYQILNAAPKQLPTLDACGIRVISGDTYITVWMGATSRLNR